MFPPNPTKRNFDAEGFVWYNDSLYIFTKNRTAPFNGYCKMYKIPDIAGVHTAVICDSIFLCGDSQSDCWVTSAALSPNKKHLALLNHNKIWWFSCFNDNKFFDGAKATITLNNNTQKEGITFKNNHEVYITDELSVIDNSGGKLYEADLSIYINMPYVGIDADSIICDNCSLSVDSFVGALEWSNGMFGPSITPNYTGWYYVNAKNFNNCVYTDSVYISYLQGLPTNTMNTPKIKIYETRSSYISGVFENTNGADCLIQLRDLTGKIIYANKFSTVQNNQTFGLNVNLSKGVYLLYIHTSQNYITHKISISE
jgi:hypothetical protein